MAFCSLRSDKYTPSCLLCFELHKGEPSKKGSTEKAFRDFSHESNITWHNSGSKTTSALHHFHLAGMNLLGFFSNMIDLGQSKAKLFCMFFNFFVCVFCDICLQFIKWRTKVSIIRNTHIYVDIAYTCLDGWSLLVKVSFQVGYRDTFILET